jgi:hypothetical protein
VPVDVIQSNGRVSEVRLVCDQCGKIIGTCVMPNAQVKAQKVVICQNCRQQQATKP